MRSFILSLLLPIPLSACNSPDTVANVVSERLDKEFSDQYELASKNGAPIDRCMAASAATGAALGAKDESRYRLWLNRRNTDCGMGPTAAVSPPQSVRSDDRAFTPQVGNTKHSKLQAEYERLNLACRGGSGDDPATIKACERRDALPL